jgi:hypothetical protein
MLKIKVWNEIKNKRDLFFVPSDFPFSLPEMIIVPPYHLESKHFSHSKYRVSIFHTQIER